MAKSKKKTHHQQTSKTATSALFRERQTESFSTLRSEARLRKARDFSPIHAFSLLHFPRPIVSWGTVETLAVRVPSAWGSRFALVDVRCRRRRGGRDVSQRRTPKSCSPFSAVLRVSSRSAALVPFALFRRGIRVVGKDGGHVRGTSASFGGGVGARRAVRTLPLTCRQYLAAVATGENPEGAPKVPRRFPLEASGSRRTVEGNDGRLDGDPTSLSYRRRRRRQINAMHRVRRPCSSMA